MGNRAMLTLLLLLFFSTNLVPSALAIWLTLPTTGTKCVSDEIQHNVVVLADYVVIPSDHAHNLTIAVKVPFCDFSTASFFNYSFVCLLPWFACWRICFVVDFLLLFSFGKLFFVVGNLKGFAEVLLAQLITWKTMLWKFVNFRSYLWLFIIPLSYVGHDFCVIRLWCYNNVMNFHNFVLFLHIFISECNFYCLKLLGICWYMLVEPEWSRCWR